MAYFRKGPPGKRGLGFGGFNLKCEEPQEISSSSNLLQGEKSPPRRHKSNSSARKLPKLSEEDYEEIKQYEEIEKRKNRSTRSPRRSRSPRRRSRSPRRRSRSPRGKTRSPHRRTRSPRGRSRSPHRRSRSPHRRSRSPRKRSQSPRKISHSPRDRSPQNMRSSSYQPELPEPSIRRTFQEFPAAKPVDDLLEYAEEQLEEEDSDDPLDAFMAGIQTEIKEQETKKKKETEEVTEKGLRCDIDLEDDQESYFKAMEDNPNFVSPEDEDELDVEYDEDGNPIYTPKKKIIEPLPSIDHSEISYQPFGKDFYTEHSEIAALNALQVIQLRNALGIRVSGHNAPKPVSSFAHFGFDPQTMATIRKQEYTKPTPIQAQAIPAAMSGRDVIGIARTGSGKTAAYVWPMIPHIMDQEELAPKEGPIAVILAPTRELCIQIHQECRRFCKVFKLGVVCAYGGGNMHEQERALTQQCEIVVATPGRLIDHIKHKKCPMTRVTYLVLDECDRMFDLGFEPQVNSIVKQCRPDRQILLFSATIKNKITRLCRKILESPIHVQEQYGAGSANQDVTQITYTFKKQEDKFQWLTSRLVEFSSAGSVLIFVTRKVNSEEIAAKLRRSDYTLGLLHGDMSQFERNEILTRFKKQEFRILVATDVAARGLDIKEIKTVVNYDVARDIDTHTHRVGRTGRAGHKGTAYTLITKADWRFCGDLVKHLEMACQEVPEDLLSIAMLDSNFKKGRGNPRKGFGRGDQKMRPGLGAGEDTSTTKQITSGPMSARLQLGGLNALGGSGTRACEIKTAMKTNYMSRFSKASSTTQQSFLPEQKFAKPSQSLYAGFTKAAAPPSRSSLPLITPPKTPKTTFVAYSANDKFVAPSAPANGKFVAPLAPANDKFVAPSAKEKKRRWDT